MVNDFYLLILHFDDIYLYQNRLRSLGREVDLRNIDSVRYLCPIERLNDLETKIPSYRRTITFIGSGDFHYITYLFLKRIDTQFNLLVIDRHIDAKETFPGFISCGSWLNNASKLKSLKNIFYIGAENKTNIDKIHKLSIDFWSFETLYKNKNPIYLSIDKDVLDGSYFRSNWDQGNLKLEELLYILSSIPKDKIIGVDICGEPKANPFSIDIRRSEEVNFRILYALMRLHDRKVPA